MTKVTIEIDDAEKAVDILNKLVARDNDVWALRTEKKQKIQAELLRVEENTWKHLSSFDMDGFYAEINVLGQVRVNDEIYDPEEDGDYETTRGWHVDFPDNEDNIITIDPVHFVLVAFKKELEL